MCSTCADGIVGRFEAEPVYCNFCNEGIEQRLARMSEQLNDYAAQLIILDARNALSLLSRDEQAWLCAIAIEFARLTDERDALEEKHHELAAA